MKPKTRLRIAILVTIVGAIAGYLSVEIPKQAQVPESINHEEVAKEQAIEEIKNRLEFSDRVNQEAEKIYYEELKKEIEDALKELGGFEVSRAKQALVLKNHLAKHNPALVEYAEAIVEFPRWIEAIGIIGTETDYCKAGVGDSRNNCGGIINSKTGKFKHYESQLNSIEDITILLAKPSYQNKSIAEMNGLYCQDKDNKGRKCEGWTESIEAIIAEIKKHLS